MITVIVDTTATFVDVSMKSTSWMQLLTLCHESLIRVVMPDVVLRETARHWYVEAASAINTANGKIAGIKKSRERLSDLGIDGSSLVDSAPITAAPVASRFAAEAIDKLVAIGVEVRKVPDHVTVEMVLLRDLARIRPFDKTGKGFRDTLVWETTKQVVEEAVAGDTIFLVTNNHVDYCDESGAVAPELLAEVEGAAGELLRVADLGVLLGSSEFPLMVRGLAKTDEQLAAFLAFAAATQDTDAELLPVDQVVRNAVNNAVEQLGGEEVETFNPATSGFDFTELGIPDEIEGVIIDVVASDQSTLSWQTYETYQDTTLLIQAEIHAQVSLIGFVYKGDLGYIEGEAEAVSVHVLDWDWNDHMVQVSTTTDARLIFQIRLEQGHDSAEECELEGAQPLSNDGPHT